MLYRTVNGGGITSPLGFMAGVAQAAIKKPGRYDIALVVSQVKAAAAGVFTTNKFMAAPVQLSKENLLSGQARGFVVNSGCANACTGQEGLMDAREATREAARVIGCGAEEMLIASTGVIGVPLPMEKVLGGIRTAGQNLSADNGHLAAQAIMTTDTFSKETALQFTVEGKTVTVGAMAKGSGMIHPDMATLLTFVTTDAAITAECLREALLAANRDSFNMVTVDRDTSTNDSFFILANGLAGNTPISDKESSGYTLFCGALQTVCRKLARMIARDGEGATKLIEVRVINARSLEDARKSARAITASNLVKAAVFGEDANWGRIICALGYSGADFDPGQVDVYLGKLPVAKNGRGLDFDEKAAGVILQQEELVITVDLKQGTYSATAWGCDLTYDYVKINGAYRT